MAQQLLIATRNSKKKRELQTIVNAWNVKLLTLDDIEDMTEVEEDGATFVDNAIKKARTMAQRSGIITLADDSGLVVDALGGAPGVYSARFAGPKANDDDNNLKLLEMMRDIAAENRTARFVCVIAIALPAGRVETAEGTCEGRIGTVAQGKGGFGYDPLFIPAGFNKTFAELTDSEKNQISHRGKALQESQYILQRLLGSEGRA
ncbi:MAG: XTP/dITP diphosphatase [Syntrophomonas sp.]|nr:XTP/dITP diphosphatase [Syntrophomonas sp.]